MSEQQYTTPEKPAGYRSYPENLRYYADHFDKYRMWADSGMTRAMRQSAEDVETLRARVTELEARIAEAEKQEPAYWYLPSLDDDGEDALLMPLRDGTSPAVGAIPLYTRPLPAPVAEVPDDGSYLRPAVALFARRMEDVLRKNDHKGGWQGLDKVWLHARLLEEARELETAIRYGGNRNTKHGHAILVANEAADVANFAMMIADNAMRAASIESHPLHTTPAVSQIGQDVVHNDERKAAEHEYVIRAFGYKENPIGSRDWVLFWNGWSTRAMLAAKAKGE